MDSQSGPEICGCGLPLHAGPYVSGRAVKTTSVELRLRPLPDAVNKNGLDGV